MAMYCDGCRKNVNHIAKRNEQLGIVMSVFNCPFCGKSLQWWKLSWKQGKKLRFAEGGEK